MCKSTVDTSTLECKCSEGANPAVFAGYSPSLGLVASVIRFDCIRDTGMAQSNNGDWVSVQNYCNLSRQLDSAVAENIQLKQDLEFAYKRSKVLADLLEIPVHESPEVTGTILGLVRGKVERLQETLARFAYYDTLACHWVAKPQEKSKAINHVPVGA